MKDYLFTTLWLAMVLGALICLLTEISSCERHVSDNNRAVNKGTRASD